MSKAKLHQLLAVEPDLKGTEDKIRREGLNTFGKQAHFDGLSQVYKPFAEEEQDTIIEQKHVAETVPNKLEYMEKSIVKLLDFTLQKETANTKAKADIIVEHDDGSEETIATNVPATVLLNFESRLKEWRAVYNSVPTCDPSKIWKKNTSEKYQYITDVETKQRTQKVPKVLVKYEATEKHPAQTEVYHLDVPVGSIEVVYKTGRITPAQKSKLLSRIDMLIQATKKARQRANDTEVDVLKIGQDLFNFIHG